MAQRACCPVLSPNELNFCKNVFADILHLLDKFSWVMEGKFYRTVGNDDSIDAGTVHAFCSRWTGGQRYRSTLR